MPGTIFDLFEEKTGKEGYVNAAKKAPQPKDDSFFNSVSDYAKTFGKGVVEGVSRLGLIMGPSHPFEPHQEQLEQQTETLNELLPTDEGYVQRGLRRGLQQAPSALAFPGSVIQTLPRSIAAGFLGEGAKDLGAPEWAQTAAELTAYIGPDVTKKLIEKGADKALIHQARKLGLSDEAIAPLLQSEFKQKWLSKLSPRRGETQNILEKTKEELGTARSNIAKGKHAKKPIETKHGVKLINDFDNILFEMPSGVRSKIKEDLKDLYKGEITGESLMNFWKDINHELGKSTKELSLLKKPIKEALQSIDPEMAKNFDTINDLFSRYYKIAAKLEPTLTTDIMGATKNLALLHSLITGNYMYMSGFAGEKVAGQLAKGLLLKPRFQQIAEKTVQALNENKFNVAKKLSDLMAFEVKKYSPELANELESISEEDFKEMLKSHKTKK